MQKKKLKIWWRTDFYEIDSNQAVSSDDKDTLTKELNLDFSSKVSPRKQVTFSVETSDVYQQMNPTHIVYKATVFSTQLVTVKALFMIEIHKLKKRKK